MLSGCWSDSSRTLFGSRSFFATLLAASWLPRTQTTLTPSSARRDICLAKNNPVE